MIHRGAPSRPAYAIARVLCILTLWCGTAATRSDQPALDVLYVPTPDEVVRQMLQVTRTGRGDVVYDLGCGDGRIVIAAVKDYGARKGVGIDIDPVRIRECHDNARRAGVTDRTRFLEQDLFVSDFRDATVLALYLGEGLNRRLRPRIFQQMAPGGRIASNTFPMREWRADRVIEVPGDGQGHVVYHWVVPVGAAGTWRWTLPTPGGPRLCTLSLRQRFQELAGTLKWEGEELPVSGEVDGTRLSFTAEGASSTLSFSGQVRGDRIAGRMEVQGGPLAGGHQWAARRDRVSLSGTWRWGGEALRLARAGGIWSATYLSGGRRKPVPQLYVYGGGIHFILEEDGRKRSFSAVATGGVLAGTVEEQGRGAWPWRAVRR